MKKLLLAVVVCIITVGPLWAGHSEAPEWMHALVNAPVPAHDEKATAVVMYAEEDLTVLSGDKFQRVVREAYKILRPEGRDYGTVVIPFDSMTEKITSVHAWCIPASGKDYEVKDKDALDVSYLKDESVSLITSEREKVLRIPAADPGNIVGYELTKEEHPLFLQDVWDFQETIPVRESHYSLALPAGWEYKSAWLNYPEVKPHNAGDNLWQWTLGDVKGIRPEYDMPPWRGVAGRMVVNFFPPSGSTANTVPTWQAVGEWYRRLTSDRTAASPEIKQEVSTLTASAPTLVAKMQAIADFMQKDIRYVAITLGIGGVQPHPAADVFAHRYGDCKDKATLMQSMLREIGVDSYYVFINDERGSVTRETPPYAGAFNHAVVAIKLPDGLRDPSLIATIKHPRLGTLLFFDPTNPKTPFGQIGGYLQDNYGLLITPSGGELTELPQQPSDMNGIRRTAKLLLTADGTLQGKVEETRLGDRAAEEREMLTAASKESDQIKPVEVLLADSLAVYRITQTSMTNLKQTNNPFIWDYSFQAQDYAKHAGNLLLVRPRVLGRKAWGILETSEPRRYPIEFKGPEKDIDTFEISLPPGYVVDDLPPAIDADYPFASYHAKTEVVGNTLRYHRTYEVKSLSVPVAEAAQLRKFYRIIASDERNNAVLKLASH